MPCLLGQLFNSHSLLRGTYTIDYALPLPPSGGEPEGGRVPFDVDAPWVRVTSARLLNPRPAPGETLHAELTVASTDALTVAVHSWLRYPDGTRSAEVTQIAPLAAVLNNHLAISHVLSTTHSGAHQLVYELSVPENPEEAYASGSESFMVGAAALLYFTTDRNVYGDPSAPVTARVGVYAALTTPATLTLTLDDLSQHTYAFTLLTGTQTLTFTWPHSITLGDHMLAGRLSVAGLDATAQTYFRYGVEAADLAVAAPRLSADDSSLTRTVTALVYNRGGFPAVTTTVQFWDGAPGVGTLLGTAPLPMMAAGAMTNVTTDWSIQGQGGTHTLYVVVDPTAQVTEFDEDNNTASAVVSLPSLVLHVTPEQSTYTLGQPVTAIVTATNLSSGTALENLAITTTFEYVGWLTAFQTTHTVTIAAADAITFPVVWPSTGFTGTYFIRVQATDPTGEFYESTTSLYLDTTPVSGQPLVSLGPDRSVAEGSPITFTATITDPDTPTGHAMTWDFGDGGTAGGTLTPTHVYTDDGVYLVTLAVTDTTGLSGVGHLTVTVANVAPIVTAGPDRIVAVSETLAFGGAFTDPGVLDTHTIVWDFGDGMTTTGALTPAHIYTATGIHTVTLVVTDDDGGVGSDTLVVTVNASGPGAISGVLWNDLDGNGVRNGTETGLVGVYVMLFADDGDSVFEPEASDPGVTHTVTPDGGSYAFSDLAPGAYWVDVYEESAPAGYVRTTPAEDPLLVTLAAGEARTVDFGYRALSGSTCINIQRPGSTHEQVWDAYIWSSKPDTNAGNSTLLYSGLFTSAEKQSLLRFDLSAIPPNAVVDSAILRIHFNTSKVQIVRVHQATATWQETAVTWNNFGGSFVDATTGYLVSLGTGYHAVDLTPLVQQWASGNAANYGVLLEQNSTVYDSYKSSEYSTTGIRPRLQVCYHASP